MAAYSATATALIHSADERDTARAVSEENFEIVRRLYEVINRFGATDAPQIAEAERPDLFFALFDPEVELRQLSGLVGTGTYRGYQGLLQAARSRGGRTTDLATEIPIGHLFELSDGRVARWVVYPSVQKALEAAGLSE